MRKGKAWIFGGALSAALIGAAVTVTELCPDGSVTIHAAPSVDARVCGATEQNARIYDAVLRNGSSFTVVWLNGYVAAAQGFVGSLSAQSPQTPVTTGLEQLLTAAAGTAERTLQYPSPNNIEDLRTALQDAYTPTQQFNGLCHY